MKLSPVIPVLMAGAASAAWTERTPAGQRDKVVISSEVPIPTATVTNVVTATETQVVTHTVAKPVKPTVDQYQLAEHEAPRAIRENSALIGRYVIDVVAPVYNYTTSGAPAVLVGSTAAIVGAVVGAASLF